MQSQIKLMSDIVTQLKSDKQQSQAQVKQLENAISALIKKIRVSNVND